MNEINATIIPGLRANSFPMRPITGRMIRSEKDLADLYDQAASGVWHLSPKLNGDRAVLSVVGGSVIICSRHGREFKHSVANRDDFLCLPDKTVLDGEVYKSTFRLFETVAYAGESLMRATTLDRVASAKQIANMIDEWEFETPDFETAKRMLSEEPQLRVPKWEGFVKKKVAAHWNVMGNADMSDSNWLRHKWI